MRNFYIEQVTSARIENCHIAMDMEAEVVQSGIVSRESDQESIGRGRGRGRGRKVTQKQVSVEAERESDQESIGKGRGRGLGRGRGRGRGRGKSVENLGTQDVDPELSTDKEPYRETILRRSSARVKSSKQ